jgi:O-acetyl-ADP-ribose deacetylase (regulator of RNase III)
MKMEWLADCYKNSLQLAVENNCKTVAFPNISTGVYGFPKKDATKIAVETVNNFLQQDASLHKVIFVCFDDDNFRFMNGELKKNK